MSSESLNVVNDVLGLPAKGKFPAISFDMATILESDRRLPDTKTVSPATYVDLEFVYNEAYRTIKRYLSNIGFQKSQADKAMREAKADVLLGSYAEFMSGKPKSHDNADLRDAFLIRDQNYRDALDRFKQLEAFETYFEGRIKSIENVCKYMRQKMYLVSRNGVPDSTMTNTQK